MTYRHGSYKILDLQDSTVWRVWRGTCEEEETSYDQQICDACDGTMTYVRDPCRCLRCDWCGLLGETNELGGLIEVPFDVPSNPSDLAPRITWTDHMHASCAEEQRRKEAGPVVGIEVDP